MYIKTLFLWFVFTNVKQVVYAYSSIGDYHTKVTKKICREQTTQGP